MDALTVSFRSGDGMRTRSVGAAVRSAVLNVPIPPARLLADWHREISVQLGLGAGDIEALPLTRTRLRWPELPHCFAAVAQWLETLGVPDVLGTCEVALMASRGTGYHHDGARYGSKAFCNVFLSADSGTDFHFPAAAHRIALVRGTAVIFDPCQPHAIIKRNASAFAAADFASDAMRPQVFLTWELPVEHDAVQAILGVGFDRAPLTPAQSRVEQVWRNGAPVTLCPETGSWLGVA
jgi:hypothetical protein